MSKKYKIIGTDLYLNGKVYSEGSVITLDDETASKLLLYITELPEQTQDQIPETENIKKSKRSKKQ